MEFYTLSQNMSETGLEPFVVSLQDREKAICDAIEPVIDGMGCELVAMKLGSARQGATLTLFVDTKFGGESIGMAQLEKLNRVLGDLLDVVDAEKGLFRGSYNLEVSSPGLDRPLTKISHFERAQGKLVQIKTDGSFGLPKSLKGRVISVTYDSVKVQIDGMPTPTDVVFSSILSAHTVFEWR